MNISALPLLALSALLCATGALAQTQVQPAPPPVDLPPPPLDNPGLPALPSPSQIVAAAPASDWVAIPASDLLIMILAPDPRGGAGRTGERRIIIQLMPAPFSQGWVANIRTLAAAHWWDGLAVTRVQDNYVAQWGDPDGEDTAKARALPAGLRVMGEGDYVVSAATEPPMPAVRPYLSRTDPYSRFASFHDGWAFSVADSMAPIHCYGMVGVGRGMSPDTGSGAELYTVIGHAPRHLDRNIAVVGRVVEGMEHLSSLPRGTGPLGFYETPEERTSITSIRLASELPEADQPRLQYLNTSSGSFMQYAEARANRRDPFFIVPAGGADICNIPVPLRRVPAAG